MSGFHGCPADRVPRLFADRIRRILDADCPSDEWDDARAALEFRLNLIDKEESQSAGHLPSCKDLPDWSGVAPEQLFLARRLAVDWFAGWGGELRNICQAGLDEDPAHVILFGVYERCFPPGRASLPLGPGRNTRWEGQMAWREREASEPALALANEACYLRLSLSLFPGDRLPEILGYALAECHRAGSFGNWLSRLGLMGVGGIGPEQADPAKWRRECGILLTLLRTIRAELPEAAWREFAVRVRRGRALHTALTAQLMGSVLQLCDGREDPAESFARIVQRKAPFAVGFHSAVRLDGRSLDDWFSERPFRGRAFLAALARSGWVDALRPGDSSLLALLDFDGPMYGVFSPEDRHGLDHWLHSLQVVGAEPPIASRSPQTVMLPKGDLAGSASPPKARSAPGTDSRADDTLPSPDLEAPLVNGSARWLFHRLVNFEAYPSVGVPAGDYIERWLRLANGYLRLKRGCFRYSESTFDDWVMRVYRAQTTPVQNGRSTRMLSRDACVFGIEQLAPSILVDGCWLQQIHRLNSASQALTARLFTIYADELGNGDPMHHHARVYRRLLVALGIDCPPVRSPAFAASPQFLDAAFDLPVVLLAISRHTERFLPELLGLNLAIELSGLGRSYGELARTLEFWKIDAQIVRLHQSIDNLDCGHAAIARDVIKSYCDQLAALGGDAALQTHWRRILAGYQLLSVATARLKVVLPLRFLSRRLLRGFTRSAEEDRTGRSGWSQGRVSS